MSGFCFTCYSIYCQCGPDEEPDDDYCPLDDDENRDDADDSDIGGSD